jgi:hypothetical protein
MLISKIGHHFNHDLVVHLYRNRDDKNIPTLNKQQWRELNEKYDRETIVDALMQYIDFFKPEPPINNVTFQDMVSCFNSLRTKNPMDFFLEFEDTKDNILEKFDDYKRPYKDHGLGVIQMGNSYIDVSNYFNQTLRMECDTYGFKSAHGRWKEGLGKYENGTFSNKKELRTVLLALWRLGNDELNEHAFVVAFRLATYIATQFKPHVAKFIYDVTEAATVFDGSMGWGDRLAGFYCSNAKTYIGCDPNPETFSMYANQAMTYERILGSKPEIRYLSDSCFTVTGQKELIVYRSPAEDLNYDEIPNIDVAFTSPPYFSTELYGAGGEHEEDQSWSRYRTYEDWRDKFYLPVNRTIHERLADGGLNIVNIQDPKIKKARHRASDDLIDDLTTKYSDCSFIGNLGMRIMQRPKNISKQDLLNHFDQLYIEPMWVFGKNRDYFMKKSEGLLDFMR